MNTKQIQKYVMRYLEATECHIMEKHPAYVTVKLSPAADKALTNRPYYWSFIEKTGTPPETMNFKFVFDPERLRIEESRAAPQAPSPPQPSQDTILGRYFGIVVPPPVMGPGRIQREEVTYGSRRLEQLFQVAKEGGRFVQMFEEPGAAARGPASLPYTSWLAVNLKVEFVCDMKRDELHSIGIDLSNGRIVTGFHDKLLELKLSPRFPVNSFIPRQMTTLTKARGILEQYLEKLLRQTDPAWAEEAHERMEDELAQVDGYYLELLEHCEEDKKEAITAQWENRRQEMEWQYRPRVQVSVINCGIFHLRQNGPA